MDKLIIVCDLDECIADLSDEIRKNVNSDFGKNFSKGYNKSYWWEDYGVQKNYFEHLLMKKGLFLDLKPIENSIKILTQLNEEGYDVHILTCPQHNEYCYIEKIKWIKKYLPFINIETNFHATGNKGMFAKENRILIDDNVKYLNQWNNNSGISIAFGQYGWNENYDGINAANWNDVYKYIQELNDLYSVYEKTPDLKNNNTINININYNHDLKPSIDVDKFRNYMRSGGYY